MQVRHMLKLKEKGSGGHPLILKVEPIITHHKNRTSSGFALCSTQCIYIYKIVAWSQKMLENLQNLRTEEAGFFVENQQS
jgi:hypothetical protein